MPTQGNFIFKILQAQRKRKYTMIHLMIHLSPSLSFSLLIYIFLHSPSPPFLSLLKHRYGDGPRPGVTEYANHYGNSDHRRTAHVKLPTLTVKPPPRTSAGQYGLQSALENVKISRIARGIYSLVLIRLFLSLSLSLSLSLCVMEREGKKEGRL